MQTELPKHDVVLWGVGHTNAHVLRMWKMQPIPNARLTCVSNFPTATYSGMLPGVLAGQYPADRMQIDLVRLCASAGARLIVDEVSSVNLTDKELRFVDRSPIRFDLLSIGIGSRPTTTGVESLSDTVVPIKPMQTFLQRLEARVQDVRQRSLTQPVRVVVVGAGAGGIEISLTLPIRLQQLLGNQSFQITLVNGTSQLVGGVSQRTTTLVQNELATRGISVVTGHRVVRVTSTQVVLDDQQELPADVVLWATSAVADPILASLGLPTDERGFLWTRDTLQTVGHDSVFAVGDSGTLQQHPTPKAGVYAVRQGMILWENLQLALRNQPLQPYRPQSQFLKLLNLGNGQALGEWRGWAFSGEWVMRWKDRIDARFMDKYQDYRVPMMSSSVTSMATPAMRCTGCGGKIGGSILSRVLRRLDVPKHDFVELGLDTPDDAAIVRLPSGRAINATVDFFAAPFDDPYTVGRIAALHAASDSFATGAKPFAALASATIPVGPPRQQEQLLFELLSGALREFTTMGATLVGGHTIEGPQTTIGFTMLAEQSEPPRTKTGLRAGDVLVLTKPLGTGVLLAAHAQAACRAEWFDLLVKSMLQSNQFAASLCDEFSTSGLTDVTGFGLAGHLLEMLRSRDVIAELGLIAEVNLASISLLPGAAELLQAGWQSTLAPANRDAESDMSVSETQRQTPAYAALFDPQTCGGLLIGVAESQCERFLQRLTDANQTAVAIGRIISGDGHCRIRLA